jgi:alkanesulfonate monooxygenase SsuD/methylene tetrahydromethanopterin reductase-like flavin-dependent oxidoreductase (luciferase family)
VSGGPGRPAVPVRPQPARPGGPPLWIGAMSERAIRRAGRLADGFLGTEVTPGLLAEQAGWAREEFTAAGRTGEFTVSVHLPVFAWHSPDAWPLIRDYHRYIGWKYDDMEGGWARAADPASPPPLGGEEESALCESIILGTPEQVAHTIDEYRRMAGGDLVFIARLYFPGLPADIQAEALRVFAKEVAPLVRDLAGSDGG